MRTTLAAILFLAASFGVQLAPAAPIVYDFTFVSDGGPVPASGTFTYDSTNPTFSAFLVDWNGILFDLTSQANNPIIFPSSPACLNGLTGAAASFLMLTGGCPADETSWNAYADTNVQTFSLQFDADDDLSGIYVERSFYQSVTPTVRAFGTWTTSANFNVNQNPVPEPSTLIPVALAGLYLVRRRLTR